MCAALSSYVHACAAEGIKLRGWRDVACSKKPRPADQKLSLCLSLVKWKSSPFFFLLKENYANNCPSNLVYGYHLTSCARTCQSLSQADPTCAVEFTPVDGCRCPHGTYLSENGECVPASLCPCYSGEMVVLPRQFIQLHGKIWWGLFWSVMEACLCLYSWWKWWGCPNYLCRRWRNEDGDWQFLITKVCISCQSLNVNVDLSVVLPSSKGLLLVVQLHWLMS